MSHLSIEELSASLDGALTDPDSQERIAHLASCVLCQEQQARYALHDGALRRLFQQPPDERVLDSLARGVIERLARFTPPENVGPATLAQDATATPADPAQPLPPAREPSRGMLRLGTDDPAVAPLELAPRLDTEHKSTSRPEPLVESYDAFNDIAYAGPSSPRLPPLPGRAPEKGDRREGSPTTKKEYRHGGVRRDTPTPTERPREQPDPRADRAKAAPRADGFGVKRALEPAWARLGFQPDPHEPGVYRDALTGAAITPPPVHGRRPGATRRSSSRRTVVFASLALAAGLAAVALATRLPTGAHLSVGFGRDAHRAPTATQGAIEVRSATTPPPVDVAVPPATPPSAALEEPRLCGLVVDAKGRPVSGALLTVASTITQARTGADGRFCLQAPAGTQLVEVLDPRGSGTTAHQLQLSFVPGAPEARVVLP